MIKYHIKFIGGFMNNEKVLKYIINFLFITSLVIIICVLYNIFLEKIIYKNIDFLAFEVKDVENYSLAVNCVNNYYHDVNLDHNYLQYFLHESDEVRHIKYKDYINKLPIELQIKKINKTIIGSVYIIYFNLNEEDETLNRLVIDVSKLGNNVYILSDSIYDKI